MKSSNSKESIEWWKPCDRFRFVVSLVTRNHPVVYRHLDTPKAARQQRFFASSRQTKAQNSGIAQTPHLKREKSFIRTTPDTLGSTPGKSSSQNHSDEKGIASLRRFLNFQKKAEPAIEPGLASMGEEDTVQ